MPEGPEIKIAADKIAKAIVGHTVEEMYFAFDHLKEFEAQFAGQKVAGVAPRGKALLIRFPDGWNIYTHNQLYGKWMIRKPYDYPDTNRQLRLAIHNAKKSALLYSASEIEVLRDAELSEHPFLEKLGPDVLDEGVSVAAVAARYNDPRFRGRKLVSLLLDQGFLAGLGNYLRSEIMHVAGVHPSKRPKDCSPEEIDKLADVALSLARQSYRTRGITNDPERVAALKAAGWPRSRYRFRVFNRDGQPCFECGALIEKSSQNSRRFYHCPDCQAA